MARAPASLDLRAARAERRSIATALVACSIAIGTVASGASAAPVEPLDHAGRWITDARGRVVVLHGFNVVPFNERTLPRDMGMGKDNARWLADNGFNTVRLGLYYARFEPHPGGYDDAYLDDFLRVQRELANEGIFTMLDVHQDQLHPRYGTGGPIPSRGLPEWFLKEDGLPNSATPYPSGYTGNPALNRAYDNIWQDFAVSGGASLHERFALGWKRMVARFRNRRGMLGYDILNEPWPGSRWPGCATPSGCPPGGFDQTLLAPFTRRLVAAVRSADPRHLVFYEPNLLFDFGAPTHVGDPGDSNAGFAFHDYCLSFVAGPVPDPLDLCGTNEELPLENAEAQSRRTGDALLLSEFGFEEDDARRVTALADRHMLSWQRWDYYGDYDVGLRGRLDSLVRAYPRVVAGTPQSWSFDPQAKTFELAYSTRRASGEGAVSSGVAGASFPAGSRTEVFVPARHFPRGYGVRLTGAEVVSRPNAHLLVLSSCRGAERISLHVSASPATPAVCPETARALRLSVVPRTARAGIRTRFRFRVRSGAGKDVPGATVSFAGSTIRTDRRGRATVSKRFGRAGSYRARATRRGMTAAFAWVRVLPARGCAHGKGESGGPRGGGGGGCGAG